MKASADPIKNDVHACNCASLSIAIAGDQQNVSSCAVVGLKYSPVNYDWLCSFFTSGRKITMREEEGVNCGDNADVVDG